MPLPPIDGGEIRRTMSMPNMAPLDPLGPLDQQGPVGQNPGVPQPVGQPPVAPNDPVIHQAAVNGVGPDMQPGAGQGANFAANHAVGAGRDWDMNSAEGMLETAQNAVAHIKGNIAAADVFDAFNRAITEAVNRAVVAHPEADIQGLTQALAEFKAVLAQLKEARGELTAAVKDGSDAADPRNGIAQIRKTLRAFRYELQREMGKAGHAAGKMGFNEGNLRGLQNLFTFVGSKVPQTYARIVGLEDAFAEKLTEVRNRLREIDRAVPPPAPPPELRLENVAPDVLEISHRTNDQIRDFQDADTTASTIRGVVGSILETGGTRSVSFTCGAGALIGLGIPKTALAGLRLGARVRVIGDINAPGGGRPISVTYRTALGAEARLSATFKDGFLADASAKATGNAEIGKFITRSYPTLDDLILDADRCGLATSRTLGAAIGGRVKSLGISICRLGTTFFRWLGRKSGEVKQDNAQYLESLKARNVVDTLDGLLAKRANPIVSVERQGKTWRLGLEGGIEAELSKGVFKGGVDAGYSYERDYGVDAKSFAPVARIARSARNAAALAAMMRPGPDGGVATAIPRLDEVADFQTAYDAAIVEATEAAKRSERHFASIDKVGFANAANKIRTVLLALELAAREGRITREAADRMIARFSNPPVRFPPDIFREYLMEGSGNAKPAKIRHNFTGGVTVSFFTDWSDGLTSGVANPYLKAVADGGVSEMRKQVGLDTTIQYSYSSEKPANPGADPRPWENAFYTSHSLTVSASTPARVILDTYINSVANKGERVQQGTGRVVLESLKGAGKDAATTAAQGAFISSLPGLILAGVSDGAKAAVKKFLEDPECVTWVAEFVIDHLNDAYELILNAIEWAAENHTLLEHALASVRGTTSLWDSSRNKVLSWSFVNGELDLVSLDYETSVTMGVNVDPVGVAVGLGFDLSYNVTEAHYGNAARPNPPLLLMLQKGEEFLFGETGIEPGAGREAFKNWLADCATGVAKRIETMFSEENKVKSAELYRDALLAADGDFELQYKLQDAWRTLSTLPAGAGLDAKVDAMHAFLVNAVLAFRT